jgi:hypothetical protein
LPFWDRRRAQHADDRAIADFVQALPPTMRGTGHRWTERDTRNLLGSDDPTFTAFVAQHGGDSFLGGALRLLPPIGDLGLVSWNGKAGWRNDWPSIPKAVVFATDWRGNLFLFDPSRLQSGERSVAVLEIATGDYAVIDLPFAGFLRMLLHFSRELLDLETLDAWIAAGGQMPSSDQCLGHRIPLVLGGANELANLETLFLRVWVSLSGQIHEQTKNVPPGTPITGFKLVE